MVSPAVTYRRAAEERDEKTVKIPPSPLCLSNFSKINKCSAWCSTGQTETVTAGFVFNFNKIGLLKLDLVAVAENAKKLVLFTLLKQ